MEGLEVQDSAMAASPSSSSRYTVAPNRYSSEDILFCIDVDPESMVEMKSVGSNGRPFTRLDIIKQAILLFVHSKLTINADHRFAFTVLGKTASWLRKEFSSDVDSVLSAFRGLSLDTSSGQADLTQLFRIAAHEAKKSRLQNRILRIVLLYCRSSAPPHHQWPVTQKLFTLDVLYLHDKPGPDNCPQTVYDALVEALEHVSEYEGYIFESGQGLSRVIYRYMCILLSHPQQRTVQEDIGIPKPLVKKSATADVPTDDTAPMSSQ
ncbi:OLC1v1029199C1 [Oldenlandia corymbosa var. corymbosa]|uniref:BRISC and BRCA1-A complex member 1 n=1 Tax=Oldenlandia corymbosa var. corymbosa TaxID=529605 RepID=A0AAV1CDT0_OLDCO|nr:OLC1v1029199C1 [Oldenlandia corymbosa var. corymbosa]